MYFKYLRYLAFALGGLCTVVAAGALFLYATFDGARLAAELSHFAKQRHQRSLRLEGPLELSMFPRLVLHVPRGSLSGRAGEGEFLGFERASLGVRLMPLLAHRVLVDRVELDGLRVALRRDRDGRHNAADLLAPPAADNGKGAEPLAFESASLAVRNGALTWNDEATGRALALSELELSTGRLAPQAEGYAELSGRLTQASPGVDARIKLEASYRLGAEGRPVQFDGVRAALRGSLAGQADAELGFSIPRLGFTPEGARADSAEATFKLAGQQVRGRFAGLMVGDEGWTVERLSTELDWKTAFGRLTGSLTGGARWGSDGRVLELSSQAGELALSPEAASPLRKIAVRGDGRIDFTRGSGAGKIELTHELGHLHGSWSLPRLAPLALGFDVDVEGFDLDRQLAGGKPQKNRKGEPAAADEAALPVDLSGLRGLDIDGVIRFGSLKAGGLSFEKLRLPVAVHEGRLVSAGHTATLYGGAFEGSLSLAADGNKLAWRAYLQNADAAALGRDLAGKAPFGGTTNIFVDVSSTGATRGQLRSGVEGLARVRLRGGTLQGFDLLAALKEWRPALQARQAAGRRPRGAETSTLGELTASFTIERGVARTTDLKGQGGPFAIAGAGSVDLAGRRLDVLSRVSLQVPPAGPEAAALAGLRGLAVPVRVHGPFGQAEWRLEPGAQLAASPAPARLVVPAQPRPAPKPVAKPSAKPAPRPAAAPQPAAESSE
ncbi:AsmA family protein [Thauera aminoaromatica]|uniref:AsmA family protein n=1 Tax=Thauera aminoaromatica TaxID=164330 RepID=A0A5C7SGE3_THASP|nr:AsmA family protein [Thauera aminoaromatica]TXH81701.1 MAG: AsmA family protein [Thauera aminoaromatica]